MIIFQSVSPKVVGRGGGVSFDVDAQDFFTRSGVTDTTQKSAVNQLVLDLKAGGIWSKMYALYPFVGGAAASHSHNLKSSSYQVTWTGSVTHNSNGITGTGGSGNTGLIATSITDPGTSAAFGVYNKTPEGIGAPAISGYSMAYTLYPRYVDNGFYSCVGGVGAWIYPLPSGVTNATGFLIVTRQSSSIAKVFRDGSLLVADTANLWSAIVYTGNFLLLEGSPGTSTHNLALAFISDGLSDAECVSLSTAVQTFQTALGRNV